MFDFTRKYEASVLVNDRPVTEVHHNQQIFVEGRKNSVFKILFRNHTGRRVLVIPSVDGRNTIDGKACGIESDGYVVPAYSKIVIPGWTYDNKECLKFIFRNQGENAGPQQTYAEAMGDPENQGVVGLMVYEEKVEWPGIFISHSQSWGNDFYGGNYGPGYNTGSPVFNLNTTISDSTHEPGSVTCDSMSLDEPTRAQASFELTDKAPPTTSSDLPRPRGLKKRRFASGPGEKKKSFGQFAPEPVEPSLGTGMGEAVEFKTEEVQFQRSSVEPVAVMSFRYDNLTNLKRLGVPVHLFKPGPNRRPEPNPFPASPEIGERRGVELPEWHGRRRRRRRFS